MKKLLRIKVRWFASAATLALLCACGSDGGTATRSEGPPNGPIRPSLIESVFSPPPSGSTSGCGHVMKEGANSIRIVSGALLLTVFVQPELAPVLPLTVGIVTNTAAVGLGMAGTSAGSACSASTTESIYDQLAIQAQEIQEIETRLQLDENQFYETNYINQVEMSQTAAYLFDQNLLYISPRYDIQGAYGQFMMNAGLWTTSNPPTRNQNTTPDTLTSSEFYNVLDFAAGTTASEFSQALDNVAGNVVDCDSTGACDVIEFKDSALVQLYEHFLQTLDAAIATCQSNPANDPVCNGSANLAPLYDQYNSSIAVVFQKASQTMQQAFSLEWTINQLNWSHAADAYNETDNTAVSTTAQIFPAMTTNNDATYYNVNQPGTGGSKFVPLKWTLDDYQEQADAHKAAQKELALLYAARFNQLFLTSLNYIITDGPVSPQAYPTEDISVTIDGETFSEPPIDYNSELGKAVEARFGSCAGATPTPTEPTSPTQTPTPVPIIDPDTDSFSIPAAASGLCGRSPIEQLPGGLGTTSPDAHTPWYEDGVYYQFSGLRDAGKCVSTLQAYNAANGASGRLVDAFADPAGCPPLFSTSEGGAVNAGWYDQQTMQVYRANLGGLTGGRLVYATSGEQVANCDPSAPSNCLLASTNPGTGVSSLAYGPGVIYAGTDDGLMLMCSDHEESCTTLNNAGAGTAIDTLLYGVGRLYAGLSSGILWRCDPYATDRCSVHYSFQTSATITELTFANDMVFAGLNNGELWQCPPDTPNACSKFDMTQSGIPQSGIRSLLVSSLGDLFVGLEGGQVVSCDPSDDTTCAAVYDSSSDKVTAMTQAGTQLFVGFSSGALVSCDLSKDPVECGDYQDLVGAVASLAYGDQLYVSVASAGGTSLYACNIASVGSCSPLSAVSQASDKSPVLYIAKGLALTAPLPGNVGYCDKENPNMVFYEPDSSHAGNAADLKTELAYLSCGNWQPPDLDWHSQLTSSPLYPWYDQNNLPSLSGWLNGGGCGKQVQDDDKNANYGEIVSVPSDLTCSNIFYTDYVGFDGNHDWFTQNFDGVRIVNNDPSKCPSGRPGAGFYDFGFLPTPTGSRYNTINDVTFRLRNPNPATGDVTGGFPIPLAMFSGCMICSSQRLTTCISVSAYSDPNDPWKAGYLCSPGINGLTVDRYGDVCNLDLIVNHICTGDIEQVVYTSTCVTLDGTEFTVGLGRTDNGRADLQIDLTQ